MDDIAIKVEHISKTFFEQTGSKSFKEAFVNIGRKITGNKEKKIHRGDFMALKDINFEVKKGDFLGIVGRNGCGKSTLLKIIAGVYTPTTGAVVVNGKLTPFIELGVGFNPELTGRDNVFLNGALLGFTHKEVNDMYEKIVEFAELHKFMDVKLKNYSSGMQVRLAFSIAIRAQSDILLLDEVLAVGDEAFQRKCYDYFERLKKKKKTVIIVTHDMSAIERFCNKAIFIEEGTLMNIGKPQAIANEYSRSNDNVYNVDQEDSHTEDQQETYELQVLTLNSRGVKQEKFTAGDDMTVSLTWDNPEIVGASVAIFKQTGECMFGTSMYGDGYILKSKNKAKFVINLNLGEGVYYLQIGLGMPNVPKPVVLIDDGPMFVVNRNKKDRRWTGYTKLNHYWE